MPNDKINSAMTFVERGKEYDEFLENGGSCVEEHSGYLCEMEDGKLGVFPLWFFISEEPAHLFRGQTSRRTPCLPTISRGLEISGSTFESWPMPSIARFALRLAKRKWFKAWLRLHPTIEFAKSKNIHIDENALAQHYGQPTHYLDLTHSWNVASFFATCRSNGGRWEPVSEGIGVFYIVRSDFKTQNQICFLPLPRPYEQKGWVVEASMENSFDYAPNVRFAIFEHDQRAGEHFLERFGGGEMLFPPDPMADISMAINCSMELPIAYFDETLEAMQSYEHGISGYKARKIRNFLINQCDLVQSEPIDGHSIIAQYSDAYAHQKEKILNWRFNAFPSQNQ